jgi:DNA-binding IclR family transcriptional regulator
MASKLDKGAVLAHFQRNAGQRFDASTVARSFGVPHRAIWNMLDTLRREGLIQNEDGGAGRPGRWFIPGKLETVAKPVPVPAYRMRELSGQHIPSLDYDSRRSGSADLLRVPSKHV